MLILLPPSEKKGLVPSSAITLYTGVLYAALGWSSLTRTAQKKATESVRIISAKYGLVHPLDEIAPYKVKINTSTMRGAISEELNALDSDLIIDCRSSTYQGVWSAPYEKCVEIKVMARVDGEKKVITHMSKKTRGEVVRLILLNSNVPRTPYEVSMMVAMEFECELFQYSAQAPWVLEVIAH